MKVPVTERPHSFWTGSLLLSYLLAAFSPTLASADLPAETEKTAASIPNTPGAAPAGSDGSEVDQDPGVAIQLLDGAIRRIKVHGPCFSAEISGISAQELSREFVEAQGLEPEILQTLKDGKLVLKNPASQGTTLMAQGRFPEAEARFLEAASASWPSNAPASATACQQAGDACYFNGKLRGALSHYRAGLVAAGAAALPSPDRALLQYDLSMTLRRLALEEKAEIRLPLLEEALVSIEASLKAPQVGSAPDWRVEAHLLRARILSDRAGLLPETEQSTAWKQAENSARECLGTVDRTDHPGLWASAQSILGTVLMQKARGLPAEAKLPMLKEAVTALQAGLDASPPESRPARRAVIQHNLAIARQLLSLLLPYPERFRAMADAMGDYAATQEFYSRERYPVDWARLQTNVALLCRMIAAMAKLERRDFYYRNAVQAYQTAMDVLTRQEYPKDWARARSGRGQGLMEWGLTKTGPERQSLLEEAGACLRSSMEIITAEAQPEEHRKLQRALDRMAELKGDAAAPDLQ